MHESPLIMLIPLFLLALGAIGSGFLFKNLFVDYNFWGDSIKFLEPLSKEHPPMWFIYFTPILVIVSIPLSFYLFLRNQILLKEIVEMNKPFYNFLKNKWYFDEIYENIFVKPSKSMGLFFWKKMDGGVIDKFGPDGISKLIKNFSIRAVKFQSGYIYQYAFVMLLGFSILLTLLIVK